MAVKWKRVSAGKKNQHCLSNVCKWNKEQKMKKIAFIFLLITSWLFAEETLSLEDSIKIAIDNNLKIYIVQIVISDFERWKKWIKTNWLIVSKISIVKR